MEVTRHRLLEGILLRLARLPDADHLILRGGMLMRLWFRPLARPAADLDLVSTGPFSVEETARRFILLLADRGIDDGVSFDTERFRIEGIWLNTDFPGVRLFASGEVDGVEDEFSVDVTFGEPLIPKPELGDYPTLGGKLTARLWMCRPETITGRKLHALRHMGMLHWRPKDLNDLRLLLGRVPMNRDALPEAIALSFTSRGNLPADARSIFGRDSWWTMKMSSARWQDFVRESRGQDVPRDLARVVAEIAERLNPILERLP
ncbi:MAG TPA: nucleotidyl transferase AbiEii/AbiGii toxin family protein [Gemmataceae bacterium]|nr:nucleotidyl transferase AbiEii/AbiGii toxin family protein [Gemmataceae bacterium]